MNFKSEYQAYNEAIHPEKEMVENLKADFQTRKEEVGEKRRYTRISAIQRVLAAVAACVCIFVGIPVMAANVEPCYSLMYRISPELAQQFRLIQKSDEDKGIRMEVSAVCLRGNELTAYITLRDLEADRIDETTDLCDSYSINTPFAGCGGGGYKPAEFDAETGTAAFLITIGQYDAESGEVQEIRGKKITVSIREFLSKKAEYAALEVPVSWDDIQANPQTMCLKLSGGSCPYILGGDENDSRPGAKFLLPKEPKSISLAEGIQLTGMGYVDGMLHIQTMVQDSFATDNHCELFLVDREGNKRLYDYKINAFGDTEETKTTDYQDCIFDISREELENYTLQGHFVTAGVHVEGEWTVTFTAE